MQIVSAGYNKWSDPPTGNSDVPEKGIDLAVIVENWPDGAIPHYIVYGNRKSFKAEITDTTDLGVSISARIITSSSTLMQKSEKVEVSDRLVYESFEGETRFIEIEEWTPIGN